MPDCCGKRGRNPKGCVWQLVVNGFCFPVKCIQHEELHHTNHRSRPRWTWIRRLRIFSAFNSGPNTPLKIEQPGSGREPNRSERNRWKIKPILSPNPLTGAGTTRAEGGYRTQPRVSTGFQPLGDRPLKRRALTRRYAVAP
jgi:hypothetical protein